MKTPFHIIYAPSCNPTNKPSTSECDSLLKWYDLKVYERKEIQRQSPQAWTEQHFYVSFHLLISSHQHKKRQAQGKKIRNTTHNKT